MIFGEILSELRKDRGMTQQDLANQLSVSVHTISSYERNLILPSDEIKIQIAKLFNVSLDYLFGVTPNPSKIEDVDSSVIILKDIPKRALYDIELYINKVKEKYKFWIGIFLLYRKLDYESINLDSKIVYLFCVSP